MEIFYASEVLDGILRLDAEEAGHCLRVLRHRPGDPIEVIDGRGTLYHCTLLGGDARGAEARIDSVEAGWHSHPYRLVLAVCPTKNPDRYEWMAEKATEVGLDVLVPVIGERSERKFVGKAQRLGRVLLSAAKQSLKAAIPQLAGEMSVKEFVRGYSASAGAGSVSGGLVASAGLSTGAEARFERSAARQLRLIAYCSDEVQPRASIMEELREFWGSGRPDSDSAAGQGILPKIVVLIGPEGDFSPEEVREAIAAGFIPVSFGQSRLRTETAAVTAAEAVYLSLL